MTYQSVDVKQAIAEGLRALRTKRGVTRQEAADALQTTRMQVYRWENGIQTPSATALVTMAALYEADLSQLTAPAIAQAKRALKKPNPKEG